MSGEITDPALLAILNGTGEVPASDAAMRKQVIPMTAEQKKYVAEHGGGYEGATLIPASAPAGTPPAAGEITDPELLKQLNQAPEEVKDSLFGTAGAASSGLAHGAL